MGGELVQEVSAGLSSGPRSLLPHQVEAVDAAVRALEPPPGKPFPPNGLRATVVSACGTGKTLIGIHAAARLAMYGRVLVLVPTLDLLTQTVREWRREGRHGTAIAVCSLESDPALSSAEVRATTSAQQLALWAAGERRLTVFATYSSLRVLEEAHADPGYGLEPLAAFDLVVVDEAHRTSGSLGKAWAAIHDQTAIPAARRLYLTATPRIWTERPNWETREGARPALKEEMAASMSDPRIFGPICFELPLAEAIRRELLARFQIVVLEIRDTELEQAQLRGEDKNSEEVRGKRMAAVQTAVLEAMATHNLKTLITFHARTMEAEAWAAGLPEVAAKLHTEQPGRHPAKDRIWSQWLCGEHETDHRQETYRQFGEGHDRQGRPVHRAVLANCRVLSEGVDIRAVDSIAIVDPKSSVVEIVQAIGRALRQKPKEGKLATLLVPVFLAKGEKPEDMYASGSYKPLVSVLNALRAHDSKMVEMLAIPQENTPPVDPSAPIGVAPEDDQDEQRLLLRFSTRRDPNVIRRFVQMQVIEPERASWARGYAAAVRYHEEHRDVRVPLSYREPSTGAPLGRWIAEQRAEYAAGRLDERRVGRLDELGMVWSAPDLAWEENLTACHAYYTENGTLAAPQTAAILGRAVGQFLTNCRRPGGLGKNPQRAADRAADLAAIDPEWNPREMGWTTNWQRLHVKTQTCIDSGAGVEELVPGVSVGGEDIGRWLHKQLQPQVWEKLNDEQQQRLTGLGMQPPVRPASQAKRPGNRELAWLRGVEAARRFQARKGHLTVPRQHVEHVPDIPDVPDVPGLDGTEDSDGGQEQQLVPVKLGVWLSNLRSRKSALTPERAQQLDGLGIRWE